MATGYLVALIVLNINYDINKKMPNPLYTKGLDNNLITFMKALNCIIRSYIPFYYIYGLYRTFLAY